jgi:flagellar protein FliS
MSPVPHHSRASAAYREAEAHPPARQIVLLHDRAIRQIQEARGAIAARRIETRFQRVTKAHAIVGALQSCLDFERGGDIAPILDRLYGHILGRLMLINRHDDPAICDELVGLLQRMRAGWAEIAGGPEGTTAPPPAARSAIPAALSA